MSSTATRRQLNFKTQIAMSLLIAGSAQLLMHGNLTPIFLPISQDLFKAQSGAIARATD
jgi:hypothetical protein